MFKKIKMKIKQKTIYILKKLNEIIYQNAIQTFD